MPAKASSDLSKGDGPAILMRREDHKLTGSYDWTKQAQAYQRKQAEHIAAGRFREAMEMDIADIRSKFGSAYDDGIKEMIEYAKSIRRW